VPKHHAVSILKAAADAQPAAALCTRCHGHLTYGHVCRRHAPTTHGGDFFLGAVLGGAIGILLLGMGGAALFGRAMDTIGLVTGSLGGLTLVLASRRVQLR
jgi:hypothetical protein